MTHFQLTVFVPDLNVDMVKSALFEAGAGRQGDYDHCCWQTQGQGQFRPLHGSNAFTGQVGTVSVVAEAMLTFLVEKCCLSAVLAALHASHPYETPAYHYWPVAISAQAIEQADV